MRFLTSAGRAVLAFAAVLMAVSPAAAQAQNVRPFEENGKFGFRDTSGAIIVRPRYDRVLSSREGVFIVRKGSKYCAVDRAGREFISCIYDSVNRRAGDASRFYVMQNGKGRFIDRNGREAPVSARPTPRSAPVTASRATVNAPTYNRVRALAEARQWDNAIREALNSSAQDKIYVLLTFRGSSTNDMQRWPGQKVVLENMHIFDDAIAAASPEQQRQLLSMRQSFYEYIRNQGYAATPPSSSPAWRNSPSTSSTPSVRTQAPRRCYQTSKTHQTCFN